MPDGAQVDHASIAAKYGGTPIDHASLAAKYGGTPIQQNITINRDAVYDPTKDRSATTAPQSELAPTPNNDGFFKTLGKDAYQIVRPLNPFDKTPPFQVTDPTNAANMAMRTREKAGQSPFRAITEGIAESGFGGNMQGFDEAMKSGNYSQALAHAMIPAAQAGMMFKGGEAATTEGMPHDLPAEQLKAGVADAVHKRGLGVQDTLLNASENIHKAVGQSAQSYIKKVDEKFPQGAIDPTDIIKHVNEAKAELVKTPDNYPRGISQMLEPEAKQSTGPRLMGNHMDLSDPSQLSAFQKLKAQGAFTPAEIARMEGTAQTGMWKAEEAKQWRSKIGAAWAASSGPMKAVLSKAYDDLTTQMANVAGKSDAVKDFADYNNLHKKHITFLSDPTVKKIMHGDTAEDTVAPLANPLTMAHVRNLLDDWDKYGIKTEDLEKEGEDYGKAKALMEKKRLRWFPGGTLGGAFGAHLLGLPWGVGAGAGLAIDRMMSGAGKASKFIESSKVSPFFKSGEARAADISRGWSEGVPEISPSKVTLKKASEK